MSIQTPIYLDYHATTPVDPRVLQAMLPYFSEKFGNAASKTHLLGREAEVAVENARAQIAQVLKAKKEEIYFTSGATESNNLAILGYARANREKGNHLISCVTEHSAVLDPLKHLEKEGFQVTFLKVDAEGKLDLEDLKRALSSQTLMVSLMAANNEIGTLHPLREIGILLKEKNIAFHCDATQGVGKLEIKVEDLHIDFLSLSAHKLYGPKGIGALYARSSHLEPLLYGGGHEQGLRSGTLNVPGAVALGLACTIAEAEREAEQKRLLELRNLFWKLLQDHIEQIHLNGALENRLAHNLNVLFDFVPVSQLMLELRDLAFSAGATCTSVQSRPSHVLQALGLSKAQVECSARFSLGRFTSEEEIRYAAQRIQEGVEKIRATSIEYEMFKEKNV